MPNPGDTYYATLFQPGADENPVTGLAADLAVRRIGSSTVWYDWIAATWDSGLTEATLGAEHRTSLTDNGDGSYTKAFDQATIDASANQTYLFVYRVTTAGYESRTVEQVDFRVPAQAAGIVVISGSATTVVDETELTLIARSPVTVAFVCQTAAGVAVNVTSHNVYLTIKDTPEPTDTANSGAIIRVLGTITDGPAGEVSFDLAGAQVALLANNVTYWWDVVDYGVVAAADQTGTPYGRGTVQTVFRVAS